MGVNYCPSISTDKQVIAKQVESQNLNDFDHFPSLGLPRPRIQVREECRSGWNAGLAGDLDMN